jgi:signal transduction histidine kinase
VERVEGIWDAARLQRVLDNLVGNAIKYSPGGGEVTVEVALGPPRMPAGARAGTDRATPPTMSVEGAPGVLLVVQDQGVGISAADLPYVFERFRRGENVSGTVGGSGIGLSSVQQIVQEHGGEVAIDSREGEGTRVTVWLPLRPGAGERA